jgi:hypothetical protein
VIDRRGALALLGGLAAAACAAPRTAPPRAAPPRPSLALDPLTDLVTGAGLEWLVDARPAELLGDATFAEALATVIPPTRLDAFAAAAGGVDPRRAQELVVCGYREASLALARLDVDPDAVERAFAAGGEIEGRADEGGVRRTWGTLGGERAQVAVFGRGAVGLERGGLGPLRPAVYFAQGKLHRAGPALRSAPLASVVELAGPAPLRAFAPGPFEGPWSRALGGLLGAATAVGGVLRASGAEWTLRVFVTGAWSDDAPAAAERLAASIHLLAEDPLGRLLGLGTVRAQAGATRSTGAGGATGAGPMGYLVADLAVNLPVLARGLSAATSADVRGIMGL